MRSDQSVRGSPKALAPSGGPSKAGLCLSFPPIPAGCCCRLCGSAPGRCHSCIFCGVCTHFPPSLSSDWQENLGLAQPPCLPLAATTPPRISPRLSQPNQPPASSYSRSTLTQIDFPEQTLFWFAGGQLGLRWVALGHMGGRGDGCPVSRSGSDPSVPTAPGATRGDSALQDSAKVSILAWPFCCMDRNPLQPSQTLQGHTWNHLGTALAACAGLLWPSDL